MLGDPFYGQLDALDPLRPDYIYHFNKNRAYWEYDWSPEGFDDMTAAIFGDVVKHLRFAG